MTRLARTRLQQIEDEKALLVEAANNFHLTPAQRAAASRDLRKLLKEQEELESGDHWTVKAEEMQRETRPSIPAVDLRKEFKV